MTLTKKEIDVYIASLKATVPPPPKPVAPPTPVEPFEFGINISVPGGFAALVERYGSIGKIEIDFGVKFDLVDGQLTGTQFTVLSTGVKVDALKGETVFADWHSDWTCPQAVRYSFYICHNGAEIASRDGEW